MEIIRFAERKSIPKTAHQQSGYTFIILSYPRLPATSLLESSVVALYAWPMTQSTPIHAPLILAGAGHAHLLALGQWLSTGFQPPAGSILISPDPAAWYSGMMPGLIAGQYQLRDCAVPLQPLCEQSGLQLVQGQIIALEADSQRIELDNGQQLQGEIVSLNVGSQPRSIATDHSLPLIPVKPFPAFTSHWQHWQQDSPQQLSILGGGAAAFEMAMALAVSLPAARLQLLCADSLLPGHPAALARRARKHLQRRRIALREHCRVSHIAEQQLWQTDVPLGTTDAVILATGASAHPWQAGSGLACDRHGFIRVDVQLRSTSHPRIFASGDCAQLPGAGKSGVYAVRQGPLLAHNLRASLEGQPLRDYHPQAQALALLATGDGGALMSYRNWTAGGKLFGLWKQHLDQGFMRRQHLITRR